MDFLLMDFGGTVSLMAPLAFSFGHFSHQFLYCQFNNYYFVAHAFRICICQESHVLVCYIPPLALFDRCQLFGDHWNLLLSGNQWNLLLK
jgi:hypothetical protein